MRRLLSLVFVGFFIAVIPSIAASAMTVQKLTVVPQADANVVQVRGGHGHHYGWGRGRGHHYGWSRGRHRGWH